MGSTERIDRFLLLLLALLLTAAGALTLLVGLGVFGSRLRNKPVLDNGVSDFFGHNGQWLWPLIALAGLLLGWLALRWLIAQLRTTGVRDVHLEPRSTHGQTDLMGAAVTDAVTNDLRAYRGVAGASARLVGDEFDPELRLRVQLDSHADVVALRARIEQDAIVRVRQALDMPDLPVQLDLVVTDKKAARVA